MIRTPAPAEHLTPAQRALLDRWTAQWPLALECWSRFTKLHDPLYFFDDSRAAQEGLTGSFAMIRLVDHSIVINLREIAELKLDAYGREILAHEIGHHVYAPGDLTDAGRILARMRPGLPGFEKHAPLISNLYTDLLINDRLQRGSSLRIADVYRILRGKNKQSMLFRFYMRIYEQLWTLPRGELANGTVSDRMDVDAQLGARLIRSYAREWLDGSGRFAALCLYYLEQDKSLLKDESYGIILRGWGDLRGLGRGGDPSGLIEIDPRELDGAIHPALDEELSGAEAANEKGTDRRGRGPQELTPGPGNSGGQLREPFQYGELLRALGIDLTDHDIAVRYYRERARQNLLKYPVQEAPESTEPLAEGLEPWDPGEPLENLDWMQTLLQSPVVIPGLTTVQRVYGTTQGSLPDAEPLDLDLYVDSSGSMPNPQVNVSYLALCGAIVALSALRTGARVQVTLWSGAQQFVTTPGFIRNEEQILRVLTGALNGATAFPIHILRETFRNRKPGDRPVHVLVISDDGVTTMFDLDEQGNSGWTVARQALEKGRGGGTLVLNLFRPVDSIPELVRAKKEGWAVHAVTKWDELVAFARAFAAARYGPPAALKNAPPQASSQPKPQTGATP